MAALDKALPERMRGGLWRRAEDAVPELIRFLEPGDVVTIKGSRAVGVGHIVDRLRAQSVEREN
jgi:UDP-N-acetylmuramyl pentapeptide synthase